MKTRRPNPSSRAPRAAGPQPPIFHVSEGWSCKGWAVRRTESTRPTRIYPTRQAAIKAACLIARKELGIVYLHTLRGEIQDRFDYSGTLPPVRR